MRFVVSILLALGLFSAMPAHALKRHIDRSYAIMELNPTGPLMPGKKTRVVLKLMDRVHKEPISEEQLQLVHTKKMHLLIVDGAMKDYQHIHPQKGDAPGEYVFDFVPKYNAGYRVWADVVPLITKEQEYVQADLGSVRGFIKRPPLSNRAKIASYQFDLTLDSPAKARTAIMGHVTIQKDGQPVTNLEPLMGAFGHIVGFTTDLTEVIHAHPMGDEPSKNVRNGGPRLDFHIEPKHNGFIRLYVQVKIDGQEIFAPFVIKVD